MKSEEIYTRLVSCGWRAQRVARNRTRTGGRSGGGLPDVAVWQGILQFGDTRVSDVLTGGEAERL